jgi:hypothetical protein
MKRITFFIGIEKDGRGRQIPGHERANALLWLRKQAATMFGGYTLQNVEGGWINPSGALVEEGAIRLDIYSDSPRWKASVFARQAGARLRQDSVLLDYDGNPAFIDTRPVPADFRIPETATA